VSGAAASRGENRLFEFAWDLAPLQLPIAAQLSVQAEAADYRPGVGRTVGPRRVMIITTDELEARLADRQAQIVRQLERALEMQRSTRAAAQQLEIGLRDAGVLTLANREELEAAEQSQQHVGRMLAHPAEGVPPLVSALVREIEINLLSASDLRETMQQLLEEIKRLSNESLNVAERELSAARKHVEQVASNADDRPPLPASGEDRERPNELTSTASAIQQLAASLTTAGVAQDDVIATLERLVTELSGRVDLRRLIQQLAELRADQVAHREAARQEIGLETLPLQMNELSGSQRANLNQAAASQNSIADRFSRIEQSMDSLANELARENSDAATSLESALALARTLAIAASMRETARDFAENRVGQALTREAKIASDLQQVLDTLRNQQQRQPHDVAAQLRKAERQLAELREQLEALRHHIALVEQQATPTAADEKQRAMLQQQEESLQQNIQQLSRQLDRLAVHDAARSTRSAANRLARQSPSQNQGKQSQLPSPSSDVQQAKRDLEQAAEQLARQRQQAEDNLALELVRRFQAELVQMVDRQRQVIQETAKVDTERRADREPDPSAAKEIDRLASEERALAQMTRDHGESLYELAAVRISLKEAERRLTVAAELLANHHTGLPAQLAEHHALARLQGMLEAFAQTASEATPSPPPPGGTGISAGQPPQRRPTFELLEVKMLRMLQVELNDRTRAHEERVAGISGQANGRQRAELVRETRELQTEQARLAELVQEMLRRNNEDVE
jgi:hypothetical protein